MSSILDSRDLQTKLEEFESDLESLVDDYIASKEDLSEVDDRLQDLVSELKDPTGFANWETSEPWAEVNSEVIKKLYNLEDELDCYDAIEKVVEAVDAIEDFLDESAEEMKELTNMSEEVNEWNSGATLIPESKFEDYARDTAEDLHGNQVRDAAWPFDCIDWKQAAEELQQDYTSIDYQGETYWFRS